MRTFLLLRLIFILVLVCSVVETSHSQTRRRATPSTNTSNKATTARKRPVTITVKNGESLKGNFKHATGEIVRIEVDGTERSINLDDVTSIVFADETSADGAKPSVRLSAQATATAREALKALRKIAGATEVGVTLQQYGSLVIDAKAEVDEALAALPAGEIKDEIALSMEAYADAGQVWSAMIDSYRYAEASLTGLGERLQKKYDSEVVSAFNKRETNQTLSRIWAYGRKHLDQASSLLNQ